MALVWRIYPEFRLVCFGLSGASRVMETVDSLRAVAADPEFHPGMRRLYLADSSLKEGSTIDSTIGPYAKALAEQIVGMFSHPAPVAFVFGDDNAVAESRFRRTTRWCNQLYEAQGLAPMRAERFRDLPAALDWLGVPDDFVPSLD